MMRRGFERRASEILAGLLPRCLPTSEKIYDITFYHITVLHIITLQFCYCHFIVTVFNCFLKWNEHQNIF